MIIKMPREGFFKGINTLLSVSTYLQYILLNVQLDLRGGAGGPGRGELELLRLLLVGADDPHHRWVQSHTGHIHRSVPRVPMLLIVKLFSFILEKVHHTQRNNEKNRI